MIQFIYIITQLLKKNLSLLAKKNKGIKYKRSLC